MVVSSHEDTGRSINPVWFQAVVEQINRESQRTEAGARAGCRPPARPSRGCCRAPAPGNAADGGLVIAAAAFLARLASFSPACVVHATQGALQHPRRPERPGLLACTLKAAERGARVRPGAPVKEGPPPGHSPLSTATSPVLAFFTVRPLCLGRGDWRAVARAARRKQGAGCQSC